MTTKIYIFFRQRFEKGRVIIWNRPLWRRQAVTGYGSKTNLDLKNNAIEKLNRDEIDQGMNQTFALAWKIFLYLKIGRGNNKWKKT